MAKTKESREGSRERGRSGVALGFAVFLATAVAVATAAAAVPELAPPQNFDVFSPDEITFDKTGGSWVLKDGEGDIIGVEISNSLESIALLKKRIAVDTSKPLTVEYKVRFDFRESNSHATVNIFLDPPAEEGWWNDPVETAESGPINCDVLNFLHSFGPCSTHGGKVGVSANVEGSYDLPGKSAPYPEDGEWVTVHVKMNETGFEVVSEGEKGYYREESYSYDLSGVKNIGLGFGDQWTTKVEVDYIKVFYEHEPVVAASTDKASYKLGETVNLRLGINRSAETAVKAKFLLELEEPAGETDRIYQSPPFLLPTEFQWSATVPFEIPVSYFVADGNYTFVATLTDLTTTPGTVLGRDTATFFIDDRPWWEKSVSSELGLGVELELEGLSNN